MNNFSIVIPSRSRSNLEVAIAALRRSEGEPYRVIVAWDGEGDYPIIGADERNPVDFFTAPKPFCFGRNCNLGIQVARAFAGTDLDGVFLMNDDVMLTIDSPNGFSAIVEQSKKQTDFGLIAPLIHGATCCEEQRYDGHTGNVLAEIVPVNNHMLPFACVYIPRIVLELVPKCISCGNGPLCEEFYGHVDDKGNQVAAGGNLVYGGEDDELCYRIRAAGFRIGLSELCTVDHCTLPSTFRSERPSLPVRGAKAVFRKIHGFDMGER